MFPSLVTLLLLSWKAYEFKALENFVHRLSSFQPRDNRVVFFMQIYECFSLDEGILALLKAAETAYINEFN